MALVFVVVVVEESHLAVHVAGTIDFGGLSVKARFQPCGLIDGELWGGKHRETDGHDEYEKEFG